MMLSERLERVCKWNCERIQEGASIRVSMRVKYSIECIQYLTIHGTINAPVTAILNAAHATGISKSESETHIHFYMITSLNNFFCFFFSLVIYKFNGYIRCVLIFFSSSYIYIHWITNIQFETNEYEICIWQTKKKEYFVQSCKWNENKDKKYICIPKWSRNHSQHKRYELQNKFKIEKRPNGIEIKIVDSA